MGRALLTWGAIIIMMGGLAAGLAQGEKGPLVGPPELTRYYVGLIRRGPNGSAEETPEQQRLQSDHVAYLFKLMESGELVVGGPFTDGDDLRGIIVFATETKKEAQALIGGDPKVKAGHLQVKLLTWLAPRGRLLVGPVRRPAAPDR